MTLLMSNSFAPLEVLVVYALCTAAVTQDYKDGVIVTPERVYLQTGRIQRLTCPALVGPDRSVVDSALIMAFYRVSEAADGSPRRDLVLRYAPPLSGGNSSAGPRYQFAADFGLVIAAVAATDDGRYVCEVVFGDGLAQIVEGAIEVTVLDDLFPADRGSISPGQTLRVSNDQESLNLPCPVNGTDRLQRPTIYWSEDVQSGAEAGAGAQAGAGAGAGAEAGVGPETTTEAMVATETRILATVFSDGETRIRQTGIGATLTGDLVLPTAGDWRRKDVWCHVSSEADRFYLHSARTTLTKPEESRAFILPVAIALTVVCLILLVIIVYVLQSKMAKRAIKFYTELSLEEQGPTIDAGMQVQWVHDFNLGPAGRKVARAGGRVNGNDSRSGTFDDVRSVQPLHGSRLAVLDAAGVHVFDKNFRLQTRFDKRLRRPAGGYAAMAVQGREEKERIVLGGRDGTITCLDLTTGTEAVLCSLGTSDAEKTSVNPALSHSLTDLAVDEVGNIYAGDADDNTMSVFYSEGALMWHQALPFTSPMLLAAREPNEFYVHSGDGNQPVYLVGVIRGGPVRRVFDTGNQLLHPVSLVADPAAGGLFVVSNTRCRDQTEVLQFDGQANFVRQFMRPWPGVRGLRFLRDGTRLAVYDRSLVRIYAKKATPAATDPQRNGGQV